MKNQHSETIRPKKSQFRIFVRRLCKNKLAVVGFVVIVLLILMAIFADQIAPYSYDAQDYSATGLSPDLASEHPLGTDRLGRDLLSRLVYGARYSLKIGVLSVAFSAVLGVALGSIAGFYGGLADDCIMRFLDIYQSIPGLILAIVFATALGPGVNNCIIALGFTSIGGYARMIRAQILQIKDSEYIEAAEAINASDFRILMKHILPNAISPLIVQISMSIGNALMAGSMLGFVGLGAQAPLPEWGTMLAESRNYMRDYGYLVVCPGMMIMISILAFNLFGDGLRDALDPRLKN